MSDKNKNNKSNNGNNKVKKGSVVATVTESLNKHGIIKCENKKDTKTLKLMCPHHKMTKKGHVKAMIYNDGNGVMTCSMCGAKFPTTVQKDKEFDELFGRAMGIVNQAKFMNIAIDGGHEMEVYLADLSVKLGRFKKTYGKIRHIAEAKDGIKKKKKNGHNNNQGGSSSFGGWR